MKGYVKKLEDKKKNNTKAVCSMADRINIGDMLPSNLMTIYRTPVGKIN